MASVSTLTVPAATVASTLTNFVTRVDLSHLPLGWWTDTTSDLGNVRVKSAGSVIPFDVVSYNRTSKTGELFFKATLTTSANLFTIETVDGATALVATDTNGRNNVWSDYSCVVLAAQLINRVDGSSASATVGTLTTSTSGVLTFDGSQRSTWTVTKPTTWTMGVSGAATSANPGSNLPALQVNTEATTGDADREVLGIHDGAGNDPWALWNTTDSWLDAAAVSTTARERYNATHDGTTSRKLWRGGALTATDTTVAAKPSGTGTAFQVGGRNGSTTRWTGTLGYIYLRPAVLSADWLAGETLSWETPASFYTITPPASGTMAATLPVVTASFTGTYRDVGTFAATLPSPLTASFAGTYTAPPTGTFSATLPVVTADFAGTYTDPANPVGDFAAVLPVVTAAFSGDYHPHESGTFAATLPSPLTAAFSGTYTPGLETGSFAAVLPSPTASFAGTFTSLGESGTFAAALPVLRASFSGSYGGPFGTDTSNTEDGLDIIALGIVTVAPPIAAPPASVVLAPKYDLAVAYPTPDVDNGRAT